MNRRKRKSKPRLQRKSRLKMKARLLRPTVAGKTSSSPYGNSMSNSSGKQRRAKSLSDQKTSKLS